MNRIIIIFIYILILTTISCTVEKQNTMIKDLQGDWLKQNNQTEFFSFRDSSVYFNDYYSEFLPIIVRDDTLINPYSNVPFDYARITEKHIWIYDEDLTKLIPIATSTRVNHDNNIRLISLEARFFNIWQRGLNDWAIYFDKDLNCYMDVADKITKIKIDSPIPYSTGLHRAKLNKSIFNFYQEKFQNIPLGKLKNVYQSKYYSDFSTCEGPSDQTAVIFSCKFGFNNSNEIRELNIKVKGFLYNSPGSLTAFLFHLNKIHELITFEPVEDSIETKYFGKKYNNYFFQKAREEWFNNLQNE